MLARTNHHRNPGVRRAIKAAGGMRALARKLGITHTAVYWWDKIPAERVVKVEEVTGVDRTLLRPDLYVRADGTAA